MFHMQRQRRLPEEHARFYSAEICLALNFLHERGIIIIIIHTIFMYYYYNIIIIISLQE